MKVVLWYALAALATIAIALGALGLWLAGAALLTVRLMGALAWGVQVLLFAALMGTRARGNAFWAAWAGGSAIRFAVLAAVAAWIWRGAPLPAAPALIALAAFLFVLALMEPAFFRLGLNRR